MQKRTLDNDLKSNSNTGKQGDMIWGVLHRLMRIAELQENALTEQVRICCEDSVERPLHFSGVWTNLISLSESDFEYLSVCLEDKYEYG